MPRYTVTIADIELCINTEETPDMVEKLVETVDVRMRGILAANPRLSKSMAAVFCAVDYCADKLRGESNKRVMERDLKKLTAELEKLKADYATLCAEADEVRRENRIMNDLISKNLSAASSITAGEQLAIDTTEASAADAVSPAETAPAATEVMFDDVIEADTPIETAAEASEDTDAKASVETPVEVKKPRRTSRAKGGSGTKNKVGDMFDMLTFKDV